MAKKMTVKHFRSWREGGQMVTVLLKKKKKKGKPNPNLPMVDKKMESHLFTLQILPKLGHYS